MVPYHSFDIYGTWEGKENCHMGGHTAKGGGQIFVGEVLPSRDNVACTKVSGVVYQCNLQLGNL